jgi:hypothetical protein
MVILKVLLVNWELSAMLREMQVPVQRQRRHYSQIRPYRALVVAATNSRTITPRCAQVTFDLYSHGGADQCRF